MFDPTIHRRRSIRLRDYDYSQEGAYLVTICSHERVCLFREIVDGEMIRNGWGDAVRAEWLRSAEIRREVELDEFVVMPNHFHGIVVIAVTDRKPPVAPANVWRVGRRPTGPKAHSLGAMVGGFKSAVTSFVNAARRTPGSPVWQRNYHEHVIRDEKDLERLREYTANNPLSWHLDCLRPSE